MELKEANEKLDIFNEQMEKIGTEDREVVHQKGLWHKTIHCWLYDKLGNVYFQIRKDSGKLYTTASGHVLSNETLSQSFHREVMEEIGVSIDSTDATLIDILAWRMDKIKNNKPFIDRAFAFVYLDEILLGHDKFCFDENEVLGVVKVKAEDALSLMQRENGSIVGEKITKDGSQKINVDFEDFLVQPHEREFVKYGLVLQSIIELTKKKN